MIMSEDRIKGLELLDHSKPFLTDESYYGIDNKASPSFQGSYSVLSCNNQIHQDVAFLTPHIYCN